MNNFPWILLGKSRFKAVIVRYVLVSRLELVECRLEDFDGALGWYNDLFIVPSLSVQNNSFFTRADDTVDPKRHSNYW